jgi:hypothetical protein
MRWHTKCATPLQKQARKALRACIRGLRISASVDMSKLGAEEQLQHLTNVRVMERFVKALEGADTDEALISAMRLGELILADPDEALRRPRLVGETTTH